MPLLPVRGIAKCKIDLAWFLKKRPVRICTGITGEVIRTINVELIYGIQNFFRKIYLNGYFSLL